MSAKVWPYHRLHKEFYELIPNLSEPCSPSSSIVSVACQAYFPSQFKNAKTLVSDPGNETALGALKAAIAASRALQATKQEEYGQLLVTE